MGALDDRWNDGATGLSRQAESVVSAIKSLHDAVQDSYARAVPADSAYGTVRDAANLAESRSDAASAALAALRGEVRDFKAEVERLAATGKYGNLAVDQLRQSVATLERAESRVQDALTAVASGKRSLADARTVGSLSSMTTALSARDQAATIADAASALRQAISDNAKEIERVRFDGYFAAASNAVTTFQEVGDEAVTAGALADSLSRDIRDRGDTGPSNGRLKQVRNLTTSLENFWQSGDEQSRKDQMTSLLAVSASERTDIQASLALLTDTIAGGTTSDPARFILDSDMLPLGEKWRTDGEPLTTVKSIDDGVQKGNGDVQAAADDAKGAYHQAVTAALAASETAGSASARLQQLKTDVRRYQDEHTRLVQAGRGGTGAAERLLQIAAELEAKGDIVTRGIRAGDEAAAAVRNARSAGEAQFFAAVQQEADRSAAIALDSANKRMGIEANAAVIRDSAAEGQRRYDAAYPGK
jgi:DNA repair ATPase RecN